MTTPETLDTDPPPICPQCGSTACLVYVPGDREATFQNEACMALRMDMLIAARVPERGINMWSFLLEQAHRFPNSPMRRVHLEVQAVDAVLGFIVRCAEIEKSCAHVRAGAEVRASIDLAGESKSNGRPLRTRLRTCAKCVLPTMDRLAPHITEETEAQIRYTKDPL